MLNEYLGCSSWKPPSSEKMISFFRFLFVSISNSKNDKLSWVDANGDSCILLLNTSGA